MVLQYMLGLLLFAGCLTADVSMLESRWRDVCGLASIGVLISVVVIGTPIFFILQNLHIFDSDPLVHHPSTVENLFMAFLYASIVSPTDPVAVLGILKSANASPNITTKVVGESLFNDVPGLACYQIFLALYASAAHEDEDFEGGHIAREVAFEVGGGLVIGTCCGLLFYYLAKKGIGPNNIVLLSVTLTFNLLYLAKLDGEAHQWRISAPLSAVAAGLTIKKIGLPILSDREHRMLSIVWHFIEELLNAVLFLLIGFETLSIEIKHTR
jgi:CPA1 family monovalent cation:H+ antiporter